MEINGNYVGRKWKITLYREKWDDLNRKTVIVLGNFVDVFYKIKYEMDKQYYSSFVIEEV